jgi:hypothetical protein
MNDLFWIPKLKFYVDSLNKNDYLPTTYSRFRANIDPTLIIGAYLQGSEFLTSLNVFESHYLK